MDFYDFGIVKNIQTRSLVRHLKSPAAARTRTYRAKHVERHHQQRANSEVRGGWLVLLIGLRMLCQQSILEVMYSEDEGQPFLLLRGR